MDFNLEKVAFILGVLTFQLPRVPQHGRVRLQEVNCLSPGTTQLRFVF